VESEGNQRDDMDVDTKKDLPESTFVQFVDSNSNSNIATK
jgi:hypothetical protein